VRARVTGTTLAPRRADGGYAADEAAGQFFLGQRIGQIAGLEQSNGSIGTQAPNDVPASAPAGGGLRSYELASAVRRIWSRHLSPIEMTQFPILGWLIALLLALLIVAETLSFQYRFKVGVYVPLHTAMHVFSLVVSWLVFAIGWNTRDRQRAGSTILLACGFLGVALLDFGHALSYSGMPDLVTPASPEKAINFSLVSRLLAALALLAIAVRPRKPLHFSAARYAYLAATLALVAVVYWVVLFHPDVLPRTLVPGVGLTMFKVCSEYFLVGLHVIAAAGFYWQLRTAQSPNAAYLLAASVAMALSQALNALYAHPYDIHNFLSHAYRVIAYILIYRGIFISEVREPYDVAERLQLELSESATRLREMSAHTQEDIEEERKRISHSLHDEMGQNLTALQLDAGWIRRHCNADASILAVVDRMQRSIAEGAASMRRVVADMRPRILDDLGIIAAINSLVKDMSARTGIQIDFRSKGELDNIEDATRTALYRMLQECLTNVTRHAQATQVNVLLMAGERRIDLTVVDNGCGFAPQARLKRGSFGLFGLGERANQMGGTAAVESAPGRGTRVVVRLPLGTAAAAVDKREAG
jgi:signal transduction histidine kinase